MIGTITNVIGIVLGGCVGSLLKKKIRPEWQQALYTAMGLAALALGFNAVCQNMPKSEYPLLFIISLSVGSLLGTMLDLDGKFSRMAGKMRRGKPVQNVKEGGSLAQGLSTGILLYCIGTLSILGPINSALLGDNSYLFTNATLDMVTSMVLSASYGFGMLLAAPVVFCWQGSIYASALLFGHIIPEELLNEMSIVGGILIAASGLTILRIKDCKTLNLLPSLFMPIGYFLIRGLVLMFTA